MRQIILIFFLTVICTTILMLLSPIIDHLFYVKHKIEEIDKYQLYLMILVHIFLIGLLILFIHYYIIEKYLKYFNIHKNKKYVKIFIDLIITVSLIGLQRNLLYKLNYISSKHPIRSELIE